tara:strand:+ start:6278 stop:7567 length:1290 start_codon:yes stop_codon:yes gene_type:complete
VQNIKLLENKFNNYLKNNKNLITNKKIAIGISGGPDSLSLAILLNIYKKKYSLNLLSFTVDHQLRPESKEEAKHVKTLMKKLSIEHKTLLWEKPHHKNNILELARIARYNIINQACNKYKVNLLMLGHHQNDQIETFIIRLEAKSGLDGLACMKDKTKIITNYGTLNILRPLLKFKKQELIDICKSKNVRWINDPTNFDLNYKRTIARKIIANSDLYKDFNSSIRAYNKLKQNMDKILHNNIKKNILFHHIGMCEIEEDYFKKLPSLFKEKILNSLIKIIGGKIYPRKNSTLKKLIQNILSENKKNFTGGGVYFIRKKKTIILIRQYEPSIKNICLNSKNSVWDRRFLIKNHSNNKNITAGPLTEKDYLTMIKSKKIQKPNIPFAAVKTLLTIRVLDEIVSIPHLLYWKDNYWKKNISLTHVENDVVNN